MLNYDVVKNWPFEEVRQTYTQRDTMLYALSIGLGADPMDRGQLRFTYEKDLLAVPSMAAVLGTMPAWMRDPRAGIDYLKIVHGEQDVTLHRALPIEGTVSATNRVVRIVDKGLGKGAVIEQVRELRDEAGEALASVRQVTFCRGDGGFSSEDGRGDDAPQNLPGVPDQEPDAEVTLASLPQSALLYRLSGDWNPLHSDPDVAIQAGFNRPILHGLCSYGMATHAVLREVCDYDPALLKRIAVRFSSPVYPGESVKFQLWRALEKGIHLRARVEQRDVTVLNNSWLELA